MQNEEYKNDFFLDTTQANFINTKMPHGYKLELSSLIRKQSIKKTLCNDDLNFFHRTSSVKPIINVLISL